MTVNAAAIEPVIDALNIFRNTYNGRIAYLRDAKGTTATGTEVCDDLTDYTWDLAADGIALARAVTELLGQPQLQTQIFFEE